MKDCPYRRASIVITHILGGLLFLMCAILLIVNARKMRSMSLYTILVIGLLFSLTLFVHGISQYFMFPPLPAEVKVVVRE